VLREASSREYKNFLLSHPYSLAMYKTSVGIENVRWTYDEYTQAVDSKRLNITFNGSAYLTQ
jgi:hypothetical protein